MYAATKQQQDRQRVHILADQLYRERYEYLLRIANRNAANREDAAEAVQEAFANFIRAYKPDGGAPPLAWLTLATKRSCWAAYRRQHLDRRAGQEVDLDSGESGFSIAGLPAQTAGPEETIERAEYMLEARERLGTLKPAERTALILQAAGFSYKEIGDLNCWTYTKTNRLIAEGRAALRAPVAA